MPLIAEPTELWKLGFAVIPTPQQCKILDGAFELKRGVTIAPDHSTFAEDEFAAGLLAEAVKEHLGFTPPVRRSADGAIRMMRAPMPTSLSVKYMRPGNIQS